MSEMFERSYEFGLRSNYRYTFDRGVSRPFGKLEYECQNIYKKSIIAYRLTSGGLNNKSLFDIGLFILNCSTVRAWDFVL